MFQRQAGDVVEWIPELDRAKDVVEEWKQSGLAEAMAAERPSRWKDGWRIGWVTGDKLF